MTTNKSRLRTSLHFLCLALLALGLLTSPAYAETVAPRARVSHVVVVWLKHHGSASERRKLVEASKSLKAIPGVVDVTVGPVIVSQRPGVDVSFDVALVMEFADKKSLVAYTKNPIHLKAVKEVLAPLASKYVFYDFENQ